MLKNFHALEICVDDLLGAEVAIKGGATRLEVCSALEIGGLTPSFGFLKHIREKGFNCRVMIRPHNRGFIYSSQEIQQMCADISLVKQMGFQGVVFGACDKNSELDIRNLTKLILQAQGMEIAIHRAFDLVPNPIKSMEILIGLGVNSILTSGGANKAIDGINILTQLQDKSRGQIEILAGGGVSPENIYEIMERTKIRSIHSSARTINRDSKSAESVRRIDINTVRHLRDAVENHYKIEL